MMVKKHVSQMTKEEKRFVEEMVLPKVKLTFITHHAKEQAQKRKIYFTLEDFQKEICIENLIEFKLENGKPKMLFRTKRAVYNKFHGKSNIAFVVGFNGKSGIVSTWANNVKYHHQGMDMAQYDGTVSVKRMAKKFFE